MHLEDRKARMGLFQCLVLLSLYRAAAAAGAWCYQSQTCKTPDCIEPDYWVQVDETCGGKKQSPINIVTNKVEIDWSLTPFNYQNYEDPKNGTWKITNSGHSVQVDLDGSAKISAGGLPGSYKAVQFHFHWGHDANNNTSPGSEHSIDGERYAMELHIVHIKDEFPNITVAAANNGLAVLGFFIKIGNENENYRSLISKLADIPSSGGKAEVAALSLFSLIPKEEDLKKYYRYDGSLTTPHCNEGVIWTLFEEPIQLDFTQVKEFSTKVHFDTAKMLPMKDNFRPVQLLNDRTVYKSDSNALVPLTKKFLLLPVASYLLFSCTQ